MLSAKLKDLERDGLDHRKAYPEIPPRVEYPAHFAWRIIDAPCGQPHRLGRGALSESHRREGDSEINSPFFEIPSSDFKKNLHILQE